MATDVDNLVGPPAPTVYKGDPSNVTRLDPNGGDWPFNPDGTVKESRKQTLPAAVVKDPFTLSAFAAKVRDDGFRMSKGYYYNVIFTFSDTSWGSTSPLTFHCNKVSLPGWRAKTTEGKIYGLKYEIVSELEQDPVWLTFNVDIMHDIERYFIDSKKQDIFATTTASAVKSFSPKYKNKYQFEMTIQVTDENFIPTYEYKLHNAMVKTVQNINYGASNQEFTEVTVEVVYETIEVVDVKTARKKSLPNPPARNKNQLKIGPFTTDISLVNQVTDTLGKIPDWFSGPEKI